MRLLFATATAIALSGIGCYNPQLGNPGFYCHPTDQPPCPDGQVCVNNRCVRPGAFDLSHGSTFDMGSSSGPVDMAMSSSSPDLAQSVLPDLARPVVTTTTGCNGYAQCLLACGSNTSCPPTCDANVTADGKSKYSTALGCGQDYCLNTTFECQLDPTMTMLVDPPGAPAGTCNACLGDALAMLFQQPCSSPGAPDCNPPACTASYQACLSSTP